VRLRQVFIVILAATLTGFPSAFAARTSSARFLVSVRASVTKQWTYATARTVAGCGTKVSGGGIRTIKLRTSDMSAVTASWAGGRALVRFLGKARFLAGSVSQSGSKTTTASGPTGCKSGVEHKDCKVVVRSFRNQSASLVSRKRHLLSFGAMRGLVPSQFFGSCPGEPSVVRSVTGGVELADAKLNEKNLFDRTVAALTLAGSADATTQLTDGSARVVQHVRWTVTLRRLGG
jgi:hypothetical protein